MIEAEATHRCKVCGAHWRLNPPTKVQPDGSWSLVYPWRAGSCCDNVAMGGQIEALPPPPLTSPTLPPEAEALVQEAKEKLADCTCNQAAKIGGHWPACRRRLALEDPVLRDLARRLLEPGEKEIARLREVRDHLEGCLRGAEAQAMDDEEEHAHANMRAEAAEQSLSSLRAEHAKMREAFAISSTDEERRLRADGWLEKAAEEIAGIAPDESWMPQGVVAVLKRHRDGA